MRPLRIAFLTPEFVTEWTTGGGIASYLQRITSALNGIGNECEIFVQSSASPKVLTVDDVRITRVKAVHDAYAIRAAFRLARMMGLTELTPIVAMVSGALGLSRALEARHAKAPFDIVQSVDTRATGLFVKRRPGRRHLVRCSWAFDLYAQVDGTEDPKRSRCQFALERLAIRRADVGYAPSELVARHYRQCHGLNVSVLRPPVLMDVDLAEDVPWELPPRYMVHFGQLIERKGTQWLTQALPAICEQAPDFQLVLAGTPHDPGKLGCWLNRLGRLRQHVILLGAIPRPELYAIVRGAQAAVLPSLVDNFPNTVIECQVLGVPVVGTHGSSINEMIEDGVNGVLVPRGDTQALVAAILQLWRAEGSCFRRPVPKSPVFNEMEPRRAALNLLHLAGFIAEEAAPLIAGKDAPECGSRNARLGIGTLLSHHRTPCDARG